MTGAAERQQYDVAAGLETVPGFRVAGVSVEISGSDKAADDINTLWQAFFEENIGQALEGVRVDNIIYAVYSDYEGDHTKPYRLTIGYKVDADDVDGYHMVRVTGGDYAMLAARGEQPHALIETWEAVWQSDLARTYKTDFEVYGPRFFEEGVHEILVCIGVVV